MMSDNDKIAQRYISVIVIVVLLAVLIIIRAGIFMTFGHKDWAVVAKQFEADSVRIQAQRGSILSDEGLVMVSSTPEYELVFKYLEETPTVDTQLHRDSVLRSEMKGICDTLSIMLPERSSDEFRRLLKSAIDNKRPYTKLYSRRLPYNKYKEVKAFLGKGRGFLFDEVMVRKNTYDRLATRTLGRWDLESQKARDGIELAYDSVLCGKAGLAHRRKVMNTYYEFIDVPPQNGCDIVTTINVNIQDIAQRALMRQVEEQNADNAVAIVMETKTGDIKAIVNLTREKGQFVVGNNIALMQGIETGSIFKPVSLLVALDDGKITLNDSVNTAPYTKNFYGFSMSDDVKRVPVKKVPEILMYSSNIGTMTIIDEQYVKKGKSDDYLKGLLRTGVVEDHQVLPGAYRSHLRTFDDIKASHVNTVWMSVGYGISVTPVNIVSFYNAVANGGKMMRPRLVKEIRRDGHTVEKFDTKVAVEKIAGEKAINDLTKCLVAVVNENLPGVTGLRAQSDKFLVAGKTGTAQIREKGEMVGHWYNFIGFFPADAPEYTCGVFVYRQANHYGPGGGGGSVSAPVLHDISEQVMAYRKTTEVEEINDSLAVLVPTVLRGYPDEADIVLDGLKIRGDSLRGIDVEMAPDVVPNVIGMGVKDAIYMMESNGIKVQIKGTGKVVSQSVPAGASKRNGMTIGLFLK